ncbi:hypothetical protein QE417_004217 [Mucilaginibacter terrae]|uniref:Transposase n=1 Tax=Mucilaginibacter terrae TaxID=1955052 RepID=A0ABU3GZP9_9SPHI|nr:hypothetical protein [Mucilaginibacter terrae]
MNWGYVTYLTLSFRTIERNLFEAINSELRKDFSFLEMTSRENDTPKN